MGDVYTLLCLRSAELRKAFDLRNLYYSKISVVMLLGYRIVVISLLISNMSSVTSSY